LRKSVVIRTYRADDYDQVWALHQEGVRDTRSMYPDVDPAYEEDLRNIECVYLAPGSHFWVAEAGAQLIGMVAIEQIDAETGRLRRMRVTGDWRRRGIATDLLSTTEEFCRKAGYKRIVLDTTKDQVAAHALYEKHGFVRTGSRLIGVVPVYDYEKELQ
jgi:ribosomal protein S18 acetylase RimI-like enzyme